MRYTKDTKLDVIPAISSFYMHEEIIHTRPKVNHMLKSRGIEDLKERLIKYHEEYCKFLAEALFNYLAMASFGESRWANEKCKVNHPEIMPGGARSDAYKNAENYNPKNFLKTLGNLFHKHKWEDGYGGKPWGVITDHAMNYYSMSPKQFVDYVVDLSHNGGVAFDKPIVLELKHVPFYKMLLDIKLHGSLMVNWIDKTEMSMSRHLRLQLEPTTYTFMSEACRFGLLTCGALPHIEAHAIAFPDPPNWGRKEMYSDDFQESDGSQSKCDECGRKIGNGGVYSTDTHLLCHDCYFENHDYCYKCGETIVKAFAKEISGNLYCRYCFADAAEEEKTNLCTAEDGFEGNSQEVTVHMMALKYKNNLGRI